MTSAALLRRQIESSLETKFPAALSPASRTACEVAPTGIEAADSLLDGGFPIGAISEIVGPASSGRTTLALSFLARRTAEGRVCAWVDVNDALDPETAAANGVRLKQLLWVRCNEAGPDARAKVPAVQARTVRRDAKPWTRLDQALRATDLLLQAGGFASIVLDLGDTAPEQGCRIPLATWFRFRQGADRTRCSLLLLVQSPFAQSSAALAVHCAARPPIAAGGKVLRTFSFELRRQKQRFAPAAFGGKKPPASTWSAGASWNTEVRA